MKDWLIPIFHLPSAEVRRNISEGPCFLPPTLLGNQCISVGKRSLLNVVTSVVSPLNWFDLKICNVKGKYFLNVFQGSGIGKMEDNLTSIDPLSYTTNGFRVVLENWVSCLLTLDSHPTASCGAPDQASNHKKPVPAIYCAVHHNNTKSKKLYDSNSRICRKMADLGHFWTILPNFGFVT